MQNLEILKPFIDSTSFRDWMREPHYQDGYAYATDAHTMIRVKSEPFESKSECSKNLKDWFKRSSYEGSVTSKEIQNVLDAIPSHPIYPQLICNECDGNGDVECNYGHHHEFEKCDGMGVIADKSKGHTGVEYNKGQYVNINGRCYNPNFLKRIIPLAEKWEMHYSDTDKNTLLAISKECEVVIMRVLEDNPRKHAELKLHSTVKI